MTIGPYRVLTARLAWGLIVASAALTSLPWAWAWQREFAVARHVPVARLVIVYANSATATVDLNQGAEQP